MTGGAQREVNYIQVPQYFHKICQFSKHLGSQLNISEMFLNIEHIGPVSHFIPQNNSQTLQKNHKFNLFIDFNEGSK